MSMLYPVALVGDYDSSVPAHQAIPLALELASAYHGMRIEWTWVSTASVRDAASDLARYRGIWCVPGSPYLNTQAAISAIRFARERRLPFLGTCGGFQHGLLEYAKNVIGMTGAAHAETNPQGLKMIITPLRCSLVEVRNKLLLAPFSLFSKSYGTREIIEGYHCSYGLNPEFESALLAGDLWATARDADREVRAVELRDHPFFVGTLFQPERRAFTGELPPLVREFTRAMLAHQ